MPNMGCSTATPNMCYQANQQRFNAFQPNSLFINQNYLSVPNPDVPGALGYPLVGIPYTIPIKSNFQYALAQQANLSIEREISRDWKVSAGYNYTHGTHLDRTININVTNPAILDSNASQCDRGWSDNAGNESAHGPGSRQTEACRAALTPAQVAYW